MAYKQICQAAKNSEPFARGALPIGDAPLLLTVLPVLRLGAVVPGVGAPRVAIFITETDAPRAIDRAAVREAFHLTQRECDVAARLAGGFDLNRIAAELQIGRGTVRSHLTQIYEKTGAHSQAALVALLARFVCRWSRCDRAELTPSGHICTNQDFGMPDRKDTWPRNLPTWGKHPLNLARC